MVKIISIEEATKFYWTIPAKYRKQLYCPTHGKFYGYYDKENILRGITCIISFKNKNRITCFLIDNNSRKKGYGNTLLKQVLKDNSDKIMTAFTTLESKNIFEKNGFKVIKEQKYDVTFMECDFNATI